MEPKISKIRIFMCWVIGGFCSSAIGIVLAVIYWSKVEANSALDIPGEIMASSIMLPFGWVLWALIPLNWQLTPMSWLSVSAFIWAIRRKKSKPLYLAYAACFIFGLFWPYSFWTIMSA